MNENYVYNNCIVYDIQQGFDAVTDVSEMAKEEGISEEKTVMLEHMILAHHYEPDYGSPVRPMFPEAELLHHLDMLENRL